MPYGDFPARMPYGDCSRQGFIGEGIRLLQITSGVNKPNPNA